MPKKTNKNDSVWGEIRGFLILLGVALVVGGGVVSWTAITHGNAGLYLGKNVLLSPDLLTGRTSLKELDPTSRLQRAWVFDRVEAIRYDAAQGQYVHKPVSGDRYAKLYKHIAEARSLRERPERLATSFNSQEVMRLVLTLSPKGRYAAAFSPQQFQEVQVTPTGDLCRIELHEGNGRGHRWAYFHCPGISREANYLARGSSE